MKKEEPNIVWSCDGSHLNKKEKKSANIDPANTTLSYRLEKKGRGGKTVVVIFDLPDNQKYRQKLTKKLKSFCGTGGTYKNLTIEIQGDKGEQVEKFFNDLGFKIVKRGG